MAVITLPTDTRWGDLGKGLGGLLGNVIQGIQDQKINDDISQLQQDPAYKNNPTGLLQEVYKKHGAPGLINLNKILDSQAKIAQLDLTGLRARKEGVEARVAEATEPTSILQAQADYEAKKAATRLTLEGRLPQTQAETAATRAGIPGIIGRGQVAQQQAAGGMGTGQAAGAVAEGQIKTQAAGADAGLVETDLTRQRARKERLEADLTEADIDFTKTMMAPAPGQPAAGTIGEGAPAKTNLDVQIEKAIPNVTPEERQRITGAVTAAPKNKGLALTKEIDGVLRARQQVEMAKRGVAGPDAKLLDESAGALPEMEFFMRPNSGAEGIIGGFKARLAARGIGQDPTMLSALAATEQLLKQFASTGSGLQGGPRIALGHDVLPSMAKQPVYNVIGSGMMAREMISRLSVLRDRVATVLSTKDQASIVQAQIDQWTHVRDRADSLWWGYESADPKRRGPIHYYYQGQEIDPNTLAAKGNIPVDPGKIYRSSNGSTHTGQEVIDSARALGVTPLTGMRNAGIVELQGQ